MDFENHHWIWDGVYCPHLFGGIMITVAVLGLSTSYFCGIGVPILPNFWPDLGFFQKKKFGKKPVRVYMDGCFDLMHYGHANALRQAKALGDELVVGVFSDEEIIANKGPPVLSMEERILSSMRETETGGHSDTSMPEQYQKPNGYQAKESAPIGAHTSHFVPTSRRIVQFSNGKGFGPDARVVYIDGAFDLFRAGHVEILKHARQLGDFLLVGIYSDQTVRGTHHPIMNLHERSLSVLACHNVDEVIIGAPWAVTKDMTTTFNIYSVVRRTVSDRKYPPHGDVDPFAAPRSMGIFRMIERPRDTAAASVAKRIVANHDILSSSSLNGTVLCTPTVSSV